jgi:sugar lactone lactonase YvrE
VFLSNRSGTRLAGQLQRGNTGDGGQATLARVNTGPYTQNIAWDASGNLLLASTIDNIIRSITPDGIINTIQIPATRSTAPTKGGSNATVLALQASAVAVSLTARVGVATGAGGAVLFADNRHVMYKVDASGTLKIVAGMLNQIGSDGDGGLAIQARLNYPINAVFAGNGSIVISEMSGNVLRSLSAEGIITTLAGNASAPGGYSGDGGPASRATLRGPSRMAWSATDETLYVTDHSNSIVRRIRDGRITTVAGNRSVGYNGDGGLALNATFTFVFTRPGATPAATGTTMYGGALAIMEDVGILLIADSGNSVVRAVNLSAGTIARWAGTPRVVAWGGDGGPATAASFRLVQGLAYCAVTRRVFIADALSYVIRAVDAVSGTITTIVGTGSASVVVRGFSDALTNPAAVLLGMVTSLAVSNDGLFLYISDTDNSCVRVVVFNGSTLCPPGFVCTCGRNTVACASPAAFCRGSSSAPVATTPGYAAVASPSPFIAGAVVYASQQLCPVGSFCPAGAPLPCPPGSFGVYEGQTAASDCLACGDGTYLASAGVAADSGGGSFAAPLAADLMPSPCLPCPPGSWAGLRSTNCTLCDPGTALAGAGNGAGDGLAADACAACPAGSFSLFGAAACWPTLPGDSFARDLAINSLLFERRVPVLSGNLEPDAATALTVRVAVPIVVLFSLPYVALLVLSTAKSVSRFRAFLTALASVDQYAIKPPAADGLAPTMRRSPAGGALFIVVIGFVIALMTSTAQQFLYYNVLQVSSLLPLSLADEARYATLPRTALLATVPANSGLAALATGSGSSPATGFAVAIRTQGALCAAPLANESSLGSGAFASRVAADAATGDAVAVFTCAGCSLTGLSYLQLTYDPSCQTFAVTVTAVGVGGGWSAAAVYVVRYDAPLTDARATFPLRLEAIQDRTGGGQPGEIAASGRSAVGYAVGGVTATESTPSDTGSLPDAPVNVRVDLVLASDYELTELTQITTLLRLFSLMTAWLGLLGLGAILLKLHTTVAVRVSSPRDEATKAHATAPPPPSLTPRRRSAAADKAAARATALASYRSVHYDARHSGGGGGGGGDGGGGAASAAAGGDAAVASAAYYFAHGNNKGDIDALPPGWSSMWSARAQATYYIDPAGRKSWALPSAQAAASEDTVGAAAADAEDAAAANAVDAAVANDDAAGADFDAAGGHGSGKRGGDGDGGENGREPGGEPDGEPGGKPGEKPGGKLGGELGGDLPSATAGDELPAGWVSAWTDEGCACTAARGAAAALLFRRGERRHCPPTSRAAPSARRRVLQKYRGRLFQLGAPDRAGRGRGRGRGAARRLGRALERGDASRVLHSLGDGAVELAAPVCMREERRNSSFFK